MALHKVQIETQNITPRLSIANSFSERLINKVYRDAGISPADCGFVECHVSISKTRSRDVHHEFALKDTYPRDYQTSPYRKKILII